MGVLTAHVSTIAELKPGVLYVHEGNEVTKYFVGSGFAFIHANSFADIIAVEGAPLDQIDASLVQEGVADFNQKLGSASTDLEKAEAQMELMCIVLLALRSQAELQLVLRAIDLMSYYGHEPYFLEACFLRRKPLGCNSDIFMYRGNTPFCSKECRQEQIEMDESRKKKNWKLSSSSSRSLRKSEAEENSPNKTVRTGTVVVA
ncbi:hypothetical protein GH714_039380 [Hevea brasiliensis]|uniref:FLZ-type domain-containing protein n=1 Tax=Hevea brasiliensis TaxID=3981 RepID=A0A6A6MFV1_HEVBR|nr:hypothetical protein GH714_039380 [Hevea brasiliensis]